MSIQAELDALTARLATAIGKINSIPTGTTPPDPDITALTATVTGVEAAVDAKLV